MEIIKNKKALLNYQILEKYEAGIKLVGSEIKSIRNKNVSINEAYINIKNYEAFLVNAYIKEYDKSSLFNHKETRDRKLLLNKNEIIKLYNKSRELGLTIIPLRMYFKNALVKVEIALVQGKKLYDKRKDIIKKEVNKKVAKYV